MSLPDTIKIDDITSGKIDSDVLFAEIDRLKVEVNILRNDMSLFLRTLASASSSQSQQEYHKLLTLRLETVTASIQEYSQQYNRLLPVINLAQIRLGYEVEVIPVKAESPQKSNPRP